MSLNSRVLLSTLLAGASALALAHGTAMAQSILPLQPLAGDTGSLVFGISGDHMFTFGASTSSGFPVLWDSNGVPAQLPQSVSQGATLTGMTYTGSFLIGYQSASNVGFVWDTGNASALYNLPIYNATPGSMPYAITSDGSVIVGQNSNSDALMWTRTGNGGKDWTASTVVKLPDLIPNGATAARDLASDGSVIVGESTTGTPDGYHAVYWQGGTIHDIGPAGFYSGAQKISRNAGVIGGYLFDNQGSQTTEVVTWSGPGWNTLTHYGNITGHSASVNGLSDDGSVIVGLYLVTNAPSDYHAFTTINGTLVDLNTALAAAGVNMSGITLTNATGVSGDGKYIVANDDTQVQGYLVYFDGTIAGLTTQAAQQASIDDLQKSRQSIAIQQDAYIGLMTGDLDRSRPGYELGAFGLYGSAAGGLKGRAGWGDSLVLTAGVAGGTGDYDALSYKGLMGAAALRYDFLPMANGWRAFGQVGGAFGQLNDLTFARDYANGAGTATGIGHSSGQIAALYARIGLTGDLSPATQVQLAAELGERWLRVDGYSETFSASNPFPATVAAGTDRQTVGKIAASWSQAIGDRTDFTLRGAVGTTLEGSSGLSATVSGFGTMTAKLDTAVWAEAGLRLGYRATDRVTVDAYATGIAGKSVGTAGHVGAGVRVSF